MMPEAFAIVSNDIAAARRADQDRLSASRNEVHVGYEAQTQWSYHGVDHENFVS